MLKEITIYGRGGQGAVTTARLLAQAAFFEDKWIQAFPFFGAERRGAPVKAFVRFSDAPILLHSQIYNPDYVIVLDHQLHKIVDVTAGLKKSGIIVVNTTKKPSELGLKDYHVATVDATGSALELNLRVTGMPVVSTSILGAFSRATDEVGLANILRAINEVWPGDSGKRNAKAAELAYERLLKGW